MEAILEKEIKQRYNQSIGFIEIGIKLEPNDLSNSIEHYSMALNELLLCSLKLQNTSTCYPNLEAKIISKISLLFKRLKNLNYKNGFFEFSELYFKLNNISPIDLSENTLKLLSYINHSTTRELKNFKSTVSNTSLTKISRIEAETNGAILNWAFNIRKKEAKHQLQIQLEQNFDHNSLYYFASSDYRYRLVLLDHLKIILSEEKEKFFEKLDLILKWLTLMLSSPNPILIYKLLDFLTDLVKCIRYYGYKLNDCELYSFFPYFLRKLCDPRILVKESVCSILRLIVSQCDQSKCCDIIMDLMDKYDITDFKANCIEQIGIIMSNYGLQVLNMPRIVEMLKFYSKDKDHGILRGKSIQALSIAKNVDIDYLREFLTYNEIKDISQPLFQNLPLTKSHELRQQIKKLENYVIYNTNELPKIIIDILNNNYIDICMICLSNIHIFLSSNIKINILNRFIDPIVFACVKKLELTIPESCTSDCMIRFELIENLIETLHLIFDTNLAKLIQKENLKFLIYKFLSLTSNSNINEKNHLLSSKLNMYLNIILSNCNQTIVFQNLFELLSDFINQKIPNIKFNNEIYDQLKKIIDLRSEVLFRSLLKGSSKITDLIDIGEILVCFDLIISENPTEKWTNDSIRKDYEKCILFLINLVKQIPNIIEYYELVHKRLSYRTEIKEILDNILIQINSKQ